MNKKSFYLFIQINPFIHFNASLLCILHQLGGTYLGSSNYVSWSHFFLSFKKIRGVESNEEILISIIINS